MIWLFIGLFVILSIFNATVLAPRTDNKELKKLKEFLLRNSNGVAIVERIAGYGGGRIMFSNSHNERFGFISDKYLFKADELITNMPSFSIASRWSQ